MSLPILNYSDKREIAARYRAGLGMPQIAEQYGVYVSVIARALQQLGVKRRDARAAAALHLEQVRENSLLACRECGGGVHKNAVRPLCWTCAKRFCQRCDTPLVHNGKVKTRLCSTCKFADRYKDRPPRLCRECGRMGARGTKRDLCGVHIRMFCSVCETRLPPGRVNHHCRACEDAHKQRYWAKPGRRCSQCGEREANTKSSRCRHCQREEYEVKRWAYLHLDRSCRQCGTALPKGRRLPRCRDCQRKRDRQRRKEQQAIGAHRCAMCHDPLPLSRTTYCGGCKTMLQNWRGAWHAGCPVARQLGTVRVQRRWQQQEGDNS